MRRLATIALLTVACGALPAQAQTLSLAYSKGDTYQYTFHMTSDVAVDTGVMTLPVKLDMKANETVKVNSVDSSGVADMTVTFTNAGWTMASGDGQTKSTTTSTLASMPPVDFKIASDGRVLSVNGVKLPGDLSFGLGGGGMLVSAVLPDGAVKPGATWTKTYDQPVPYGGGSLQVTANSKYLRNEPFQGVQAAVVETMSTMKVVIGTGAANSTAVPSLSGTTSSDVTSWIDPAAHRLLKSMQRSTLDFTLSSFGATGGGTMPGITGPLGLKGSQTLDLEPA